MIENTLNHRQPLPSPSTLLPKNSHSELKSNQGLISISKSLSTPSPLNFQGHKEIRQACDLLFIGQACPSDYGQGRLAKKTTQIFATGDPWVVLHSNPLNKHVMVNLSATDKNDDWNFETRLVEALQTCWAARENGSQDIVLQLPSDLNPDTCPSRLNRLIQTLAFSLGVNQLDYHQQDTSQRLTQQVHKPIPTGTYSIKRAEVSSGQRTSTSNTDRLRSTEAPAHHIILAGSANPQLAQSITQAIEQQGHDAEFVPHQYLSEGPETDIVVNTNLNNAQVIITLSTRPEPESEGAQHYVSAARYLLEAFLLAQKALEDGAHSVKFAIAYQPNARSDKRETSSRNYAGAYSSMVGRFCDGIGIVKEVVLLETHDRHSECYFTNAGCRGTMVPGLMALAKAHLKAQDDGTQTVLVAPDDGAVKRTKALSQELGLPMVTAQKSRAGHSDDNATVSQLNSGFELDSQRNYLLTDDETATGGTLRQVLKRLRAQGAEKISVAVAHNNMPLNQWERHMCLAALVLAGANKVTFLDTQPMGALVNSWQEFQQLSQNNNKSLTDAREWLSKKMFEGETISHKTWQAFEKVFDNFGSKKISVMSAAPLLAQALTAPASIEQRVQQVYQKALAMGATNILATRVTDYGIAAAASLRLNIPWTMARETGKLPQPQLLGKELQVNANSIRPEDHVLVLGPENANTQALLEAIERVGVNALVKANEVKDYTGIDLPENSLISRESVNSDSLKQARDIVRSLPSYSHRGISFIDMGALGQQPTALSQVVQAMADRVQQFMTTHGADKAPVKLLSLGARGHMFSVPMSLLLKSQGLACEVVPVEKADALSNQSEHVIHYEREYGASEMAVPKDAIDEGDQCIVVDDILATGGSADAAAQLAERSLAKVVGFVGALRLDFPKEQSALARRYGSPEHVWCASDTQRQ